MPARDLHPGRRGMARRVIARARQWLSAHLPRHPLARGVTLLAGGTALSQGILLAASPVLTRLYGPGEFGVYAVFASLNSIFVVIGSLAYHLAIPLPSDDEDATNLLGLALLLSLFVGLCVGGGGKVLGHAAAKAFREPAIERVLWLLGLSVAGGGAFQAMTYWASRRSRFGLLGRTKAWQASAQGGTQALGGLLHLGSTGLIVGLVMSQWVGLWGLLRRAGVRWRSLTIHGTWRCAVVYKRFPLFTTWATLTNVLGLQLPSILLAKYFTADTAGYYALTVRVLGIPTMLAGQACAQVFYPTVAAMRGRGEAVSGITERFAVGLALLSVAVFGVFVIEGPFVFAVAFGSRWREAGHFAQYLALWFMVSLVSSPLSSLALVFDQQRRALLITVYETVLRMTALAIGIVSGSVFLAIALYAGVSVLIAGIYLAWVLHLAGSGLGAFCRRLGPLMVAAPLIAALLIAARGHADPWLIVGASIMAFGGLAAWALKREGGLG